MTRKTVEIQALKDKVNGMLKLSTCSREGRLSLDCLLSSVLSDAGQYKGFRYLTEEEVPEGQLPGIRAGLYIDTVFPDDSRKHFY